MTTISSATSAVGRAAAPRSASACTRRAHPIPTRRPRRGSPPPALERDRRASLIPAANVAAQPSSISSCVDRILFSGNSIATSDASRQTTTLASADRRKPPDAMHRRRDRARAHRGQYARHLTAAHQRGVLLGCVEPLQFLVHQRLQRAGRQRRLQAPTARNRSRTPSTTGCGHPQRECDGRQQRTDDQQPSARRGVRQSARRHLEHQAGHRPDDEQRRDLPHRQSGVAEQQRVHGYSSTKSSRNRYAYRTPARRR